MGFRAAGALNVGCWYPPGDIRQWQETSVVTARRSRVPRVGGGQGRRSTSYSARDAPRHAVSSSPQDQQCRRGESLLWPGCPVPFAVSALSLPRSGCAFRAVYFDLLSYFQRFLSGHLLCLCTRGGESSGSCRPRSPALSQQLWKVTLAGHFPLWT